LQMMDTFKSKQWKVRVWHGLIAVLYLFGGLIILYDPILASTILTAMIASILIIIGVARIAMASVLRDESGWGWLLVAGIIAIVLGVIILSQWPWSGLWVIGLFISIEVIISGWTY